MFDKPAAACSTFSFLPPFFGFPSFLIHELFLPLFIDKLSLDSLGDGKTKSFTIANGEILFNSFFFFSCSPDRAVKFTSKLFGRALSRRIKATVLYASETGKSEQYAKQLVELLSHAFNAQVSGRWVKFLISGGSKGKKKLSQP